jgi:hypothetical protein
MTQSVTFTVDQLNQMLAYCDQLPYRFAKPLIDQIQQIAGPQLQEIQTNGATNPQVQATINETEANQD